MHSITEDRGWVYLFQAEDSTCGPICKASKWATRRAARLSKSALWISMAVLMGMSIAQLS